MERFINDVFAEIKQEINLNIKILDARGELKYSSTFEVLPTRTGVFRNSQESQSR